MIQCGKWWPRAPGENEVAVFPSAPCAALPRAALCVTRKLIRWYLEHPRQGGTGMRPWQNWSKLNLLWETVPVYIRSQRPFGSKTRHPFFGQDHKCTPRFNKGSEPQSGSRGIFSITLTGHSKALNHPNFHFLFWKSMSLSHQTSEIKSAFQLLWPFSALYRPEFPRSCMFKEHRCSIRR